MTEPQEKEKAPGRSSVPLHQAVLAGLIEEVSKRLDEGEPIDERAADGSTALHYAVRSGSLHSLDICALLLERGANPNAQRSTDGYAPLHELVSTSYRKDERAINFLDELHAHGADIHLRAFEQESVMGLAACQNLAICIRRLIDLGAHPDSPLTLYPPKGAFGLSGGFRSALGIASWHAHIETIQVLIDAGADVDYNDFGQPPLLEIVCNRGASQDPKRYVEGARLLLDAGADIHATARYGGYTPLGRTVSNGNLELVKLLIERGADPKKTNDQNHSLLLVAQNGGHADIIKNGRDAMIRYVETLALSDKN